MLSKQKYLSVLLFLGIIACTTTQSQSSSQSTQVSSISTEVLNPEPIKIKLESLPEPFTTQSAHQPPRILPIPSPRVFNTESEKAVVNDGACIPNFLINERDGLGDDLVPDYFTRVKAGGFNGWPYSYLSTQLLDPRHLKKGKSTNPQLVSQTITPDALFQSHD
jgi:glucose/arabinose dehydrogenase